MRPVIDEAAVVGSADVLDNLDEVVFRTDADGRWTYLNAAWERLTGFPVAEALGRHFLDYVHPDEREGTLQRFLAVAAGGADTCHHETRYLRADGGATWVELRARLLRGPDGAPEANAGTILDINHRRTAEELLGDQTRVLELIAGDEPLPDVLAATATMVARRVGAPTSIVAFHHVTAGHESVPAGEPGVVVAVDADGRPVAARPDIAAIPVHEPGSERTLGSMAVALEAGLELDEVGRGVVGRALDLAAVAISRSHREQEVRRRALADALTGLPNRSATHDRFDRAVAESRRSGRAVAVLLVDLDGFKDVNDMLGHDLGDRVLIEVARRLRHAVGAGGSVGRLGSDEFVAVLPGIGGAPEAARAAADVQLALKPLFELDGVGLRVHASVGIALAPQHGVDFEVLLRRADAAMYRVKPTGSAAAVFDPASDEGRVSRVAVAAELRRAIEADELLLEYQPKIDLRRGEVVGVEALVRWGHPTRGVVAPADFIGLAEGTGLIKPLTWWVLETALAEMEQWRGDAPDLGLAVNLSAPLLRDPELGATVADALVRWRLDDGQLELELTESALLSDPEAAIRVMGDLADAGVAFALDDFGTGYSSLSYLKRVPARTLKIDRSFVRDVATDARDASIVRATVDLAHNVGITVVAEGIEDEAMRRRVGELGCDQAQGFHLGRPMPAAGLADWLRATGEVSDVGPSPASRARTRG